jgi:hypothetical protein
MVKRCALIGFVDIDFYRMVVKRCFDAPSFLLDEHLFDIFLSRCISGIFPCIFSFQVGCVFEHLPT